MRATLLSFMESTTRSSFSSDAVFCTSLRWCSSKITGTLPAWDRDRDRATLGHLGASGTAQGDIAPAQGEKGLGLSELRTLQSQWNGDIDGIMEYFGWKIPKHCQGHHWECPQVPHPQGS